MSPTNSGGLDERVVVIDGGFSTQLSCHVGHIIDGDPLWSARFLYSNPEAVMNTHLDFMRAGAEIVISATYQASVDGYVEHLGMNKQQAKDLIKSGVELVKKAREIYLSENPEIVKTGKIPLVAGSIGPYGAHLHDGSEYTGSYADTTSIEVMREWHKPRMEALIEAEPDLIALETIPCQEEAEMLVDMLKSYPHIKAWLSFSCKDNKSISHGESFQKVATKCFDMSPTQLIAVGTNCCSPTIISGLLKGINNGRESNPIPLIVYPNSGEKYNPLIGWIDRDQCVPVETFVEEFLDLGVRYIGGCCRTYAADVTQIRNRVVRYLQHKKTIV